MILHQRLGSGHFSRQCQLYQLVMLLVELIAYLGSPWGQAPIAVELIMELLNEAQ